MILAKYIYFFEYLHHRELTFLALNGEDIATASKVRTVAMLVVNRKELEHMQNG
jgi:hypothetical protein